MYDTILKQFLLHSVKVFISLGLNTKCLKLKSTHNKIESADLHPYSNLTLLIVFSRKDNWITFTVSVTSPDSFFWLVFALFNTCRCVVVFEVLPNLQVVVFDWVKSHIWRGQESVNHNILNNHPQINPSPSSADTRCMQRRRLERAFPQVSLVGWAGPFQGRSGQPEI